MSYAVYYFPMNLGSTPRSHAHLQVRDDVTFGEFVAEELVVAVSGGISFRGSGLMRGRSLSVFVCIGVETDEGVDAALFAFEEGGEFGLFGE